MRSGVRLRCPACEAPEEPKPTPPADELQCSRCGATYRVVDGIAHLHVDDWRWRTKQAESAGWEALSDELGQLDHPGGGPAVDFEIPYVDDPTWRSIAENFDAMTAGLDVAGSVVLDIGAGRPWAAKHFALRGARAVAVDVNGHPVVGLGRGAAMAAEAGVVLDLLVGDSERLPIDDAAVDVVFVSAAMHHTDFLRRFAREIARVLVPGGTAIVINEPTRAATDDESDLLLLDAEPELRHGITERRPTVVEYVLALRAAGLTVDEARLDVHDAPIARIRPRLTLPALGPVGREWLLWTAIPRFVRAAVTRHRHRHHERALRRALPKRTPGLAGDHAQRIAAVYGRNILDLRATKPAAAPTGRWFRAARRRRDPRTP